MDKATRDFLTGYDAKLATLGAKVLQASDKANSTYSMWCHLRWMLAQVLSPEAEKWPDDKIAWFCGFIQGNMWGCNESDIIDIRKDVKKLFGAKK